MFRPSHNLIAAGLVIAALPSLAQARRVDRVLDSLGVRDAREEVPDEVARHLLAAHREVVAATLGDAR